MSRGKLTHKVWWKATSLSRLLGHANRRATGQPLFLWRCRLLTRALLRRSLPLCCRADLRQYLREHLSVLEARLETAGESFPPANSWREMDAWFEAHWLIQGQVWPAFAVMNGVRQEGWNFSLGREEKERERYVSDLAIFRAFRAAVTPSSDLSRATGVGRLLRDIRGGYPGMRAEVFRDIFPDPFLPEPVLEESWRTPALVQVASALRRQPSEEAEGGLLDPVAISALADALEEAGCGDSPCPRCQCAQRDCERCFPCQDRGWVLHPLLEHLRTPRRHFPGCWVVELCAGRPEALA